MNTEPGLVGRGIDRAKSAAAQILALGSPPDRPEIERQQLAMIAGHMPMAAATVVIFASLIAYTVSGAYPALAAADQQGVIAWYMLALLQAPAVLYAGRAFRRDGDALARVTLWRNRFRCVYLVNGGVWSSMVLLAWNADQGLNQALMVMVMVGVTTAYIVSIAPHLPTFIVGLTVLITPVIVVSLFSGGELSSAIALMLPPYFVYAALLGLKANRSVEAGLVRMLDLQEMTERLEEARKRAENADEAKSSFLAMMSHELRTPLNAVIGFSDIMRTELFGPVNNAHYRDYVDNIHKSGRHLLGLINDVLDMSKIEIGQLQLVPEECDAGELAAEAAQLTAERAAQRRVVLRLVPSGGVRIIVDPVRVKQVLINLLTNAARFTPEGRAVRLSWGRSDDGGFFYSVQDEGPGIAPEHVEDALTPFRQVGDLDATRASEGTGLGLPICRALAEAHDGELTLANAPDGGLVARLSIPAARVVSMTPSSGDAQRVA